MAKISSKKVRVEIFSKYNGKCAYCGCELNDSNFTIDHIFPKNRGISNVKKGKDSISNYNPSCFSCNSSKCNMQLEEWRKHIENKINLMLENDASFKIIKRFNLVKLTNKPVVFYFENH